MRWERSWLVIINKFKFKQPSKCATTLSKCIPSKQIVFNHMITSCSWCHSLFEFNTFLFLLCISNPRWFGYSDSLYFIIFTNLHGIHQPLIPWSFHQEPVHLHQTAPLPLLHSPCQAVTLSVKENTFPQVCNQQGPASEVLKLKYWIGKSLHKIKDSFAFLFNID